MKTLVLGLGNPILTDDGVGIHVARAACARLQAGAGEVSFEEASVGGLRLLEVIAGYDRLILVDAITTPGGAPGQIHRLSPADAFASSHAGSTHDFSFPEALAWGRRHGLTLPADENIVIIAVEVVDPLTFGETLTPAVAAAVPSAAEAVLAVLRVDERRETNDE